MTLGERVWPEIDGRPTLLVPVGSVEQHGPHLPLDTDTRIAAAVAARAATGALLVAPSVAYGASGEHEGFAGTVSIGHEALRLLLVELGRSASRWAARLVFVNGHGGNLSSLVEAVRLLRYERRDAAWFACAAGGDAHAGRTETSLMLALGPALVRPQRAAGNTAPLADLLPTMRAGGVAAVSPNGVLGDPAGASADEGEQLLAAMSDSLRAAITRWTPDAGGRLR
ncbi:mycofactocin biosynthesis peptidyl-dipeptidase MftE [Pseudonocardia charpentierae]|uniref:Mycofactocin biosynthesis peptidyl-dipeptidase MftE n=1 Tax=Pseudonocardia charpentierae TaxID=3075545 RepID=A0ABU2NC52_9PSEU|nr:mycofactocin biosynthesis peptidyl-dipeptidase MftE [Pseudonocardia sp. DSM 45834]MDT0350849.1 mycofactocin biosynthesis peptidyl-dipeptidase MftE [Pseudonocardia sp. DSM 45834]